MDFIAKPEKADTDPDTVKVIFLLETNADEGPGTGISSGTFLAIAGNTKGVFVSIKIVKAVVKPNKNNFFFDLVLVSEKFFIFLFTLTLKRKNLSLILIIFKRILNY